MDPGSTVPAFVTVFLAELPDKTIVASVVLVAASLAAGTGSPVSVAAGALLALTSVAALAVTAGRQLLARLPLHVVRLEAAAVLAALAVAALVRLLT